MYFLTIQSKWCVNLLQDPVNFTLPSIRIWLHIYLRSCLLYNTHKYYNSTSPTLSSIIHLLCQIMQSLQDITITYLFISKFTFNCINFSCGQITTLKFIFKLAQFVHIFYLSWLNSVVSFNLMELNNWSLFKLCLLIIFVFFLMDIRISWNLHKSVCK